MQQIAAAFNWQERVNENFRSVSPAGLYGINPALTTGLVLAYLGGNFNGAAVANGTVSLTGSTTNYVVAERATGDVSASTGTTDWLDDTNFMQLYSVVTGSSTITTIDDFRQAYGGAGGGGGGGGGSDMLSVLTASEISVTTTATLTLGRMHVCSGTSADYTVTLPAASGNAGKFVGVRMAPGLTRWVTVDGNGSELIDGATTRRMWARESAILMCDGTGWAKVGGRSIPLKCTMNKAGTTSIAAGAWTLMPMDTVVHDNTSGLATPMGDTSNGWIRCLRGGSYSVTGASNYTGVTVGKLQAVGVINRKLSVPGGYSIDDPQDDPMAWLSLPVDAAGSCFLNASGNFDGVLVGDSLAVTTFNNDTVSRSNASSNTIKPSLSVFEICDW
ncbi:hypothetical protein [Variovorax sp. JS1663]|uniref:hypothetical protein n=1 Tax=Variovorax sp. JS1663 TaxID=1851577 RepID=UPI000B708E1B|nr:hypothetical protein [Variovorax sp. JS1663]OUL98537.1 hypothetical protein A8M77_30925 [Variovorax sp. JS1663]